MPSTSASLRLGLAFAITAYTSWGVFPLFWRLLESVPSFEVVCHRVIWSTVFLLIAIALIRWKQPAFGIELIGAAEAPETAPDVQAEPRRTGQSHGAFQPISRTRLWVISALAAVSISINWLSFIWAVNHDRVLDASLGYYIAPLVNVALGVVVLGERLSRWQWLAIVIATAGVTSMSIAGGTVPWVSLAMALSFGIYGLLKKRVPMPALIGLLTENLVLGGPALIYLASLAMQGGGAMGRLSWQIDALLVAGGVVSVPPLMLFALAVRRVSLSTIGVLQYIGPTLQLWLGVLVMGEGFGYDRILGFSLVWTGSLIYIAGAHHAFQKAQALQESATVAVPESCQPAAGHEP